MNGYENLTIEVSWDGISIGRAYHVGSNKWEVCYDPELEQEKQGRPDAVVYSSDEVVDKLVEVAAPELDEEEE